MNPTGQTYPKFVAVLTTTQGEFPIAQADDLPTLAAQARFWLDMGTQGQQITDGQIQRITIEEHDPTTNQLVVHTSKRSGKRKVQARTFTVRSRAAVIDKLNSRAQLPDAKKFQRAETHPRIKRGPDALPVSQRVDQSMPPQL